MKDVIKDGGQTCPNTVARETERLYMHTVLNSSNRPSALTLISGENSLSNYDSRGESRNSGTGGHRIRKLHETCPW